MRATDREWNARAHTQPLWDQIYASGTAKCHGKEILITARILRSVPRKGTPARQPSPDKPELAYTKGDAVGQVVTCEVNGVSVLLDVEPEARPGEARNFEAWRAETYATKEPDTIAWIDSCIRPGDVLYDVGANIGQYSLYAALKLGKECRVLAFEPEALTFAKLNQNIVLNDLTESVTAYCLSVADRTALDFFYVKAFAPGASLHAWGRKITQGEKPFLPKNRQGSMGVSLDDLTGRFGLPFPNHIKVDVDGIEAAIVRGARETLRDARMKSVLVEVFMHEDTADQVKAMFSEAGWRLDNAAEIAYTPGTVQNLIFKKA